MNIFNIGDRVVVTPIGIKYLDSVIPNLGIKYQNTELLVIHSKFWGLSVSRGNDNYVCIDNCPIGSFEPLLDFEYEYI